MSHFTHRCECSHDYESHSRQEPHGCMLAQSQYLGGCGCATGNFGPSFLRETVVPAWVDGHAIGNRQVTPLVEPGTQLGLGGTPPAFACDCDRCQQAYAAAPDDGDGRTAV